MFDIPSKIAYTENGYRTPEVNSIVDSISLISRRLKQNKKGIKLDIEALCLEVNPLVQNSNSLLEDLRRLNQLRDYSYQNDLDIDKINQIKHIKLTSTKKQ